MCDLFLYSQVRRSSWRKLPYVVAHSLGRFAQSSVSNALRAGGLSADAFSKSLAANLPEGHNNPTLAEALLRGVGNLARETVRCVWFVFVVCVCVCVCV